MLVRRGAQTLARSSRCRSKKASAAIPMASSAGGTAADATLEEAKKEVKLAEYTPPTHLIDSVTLDCDLRAPDDARIRATQRVRVRDASNPASRLELDGSPDIELL